MDRTCLSYPYKTIELMPLRSSRRDKPVSDDSVDEDSDFFIGGLLLPWGTSVGSPGIWMDIAEERIVFRPRYFSRFFGPWIVDRVLVANVYTDRGTLLTISRSVKIVEKGGFVWTFWTPRPTDVAESLQEWGYPVTAGARSSS